jgi:hypothetical protein
MNKTLAFRVFRVAATVLVIGAIVGAMIGVAPDVVTALAALSLGFGALAVLYEY